MLNNVQQISNFNLWPRNSRIANHVVVLLCRSFHCQPSILESIHHYHQCYGKFAKAILVWSKGPQHSGYYDFYGRGFLTCEEHVLILNRTKVIGLTDKSFIRSWKRHPEKWERQASAHDWETNHWVSFILCHPISLSEKHPFLRIRDAAWTDELWGTGMSSKGRSSGRSDHFLRLILLLMTMRQLDPLGPLKLTIQLINNQPGPGQLCPSSVSCFLSCSCTPNLLAVYIYQKHKHLLSIY